MIFETGGKMIEMDLNHCQIVGKSLAGDREVDEGTFASLTILTERLERLKKVDEIYRGISISPHVEELQAHRNTVGVS
jgi:hypothetical protein